MVVFCWFPTPPFFFSAAFKALKFTYLCTYVMLIIYFFRFRRRWKYFPNKRVRFRIARQKPKAEVRICIRQIQQMECLKEDNAAYWEWLSSLFHRKSQSRKTQHLVGRIFHDQRFSGCRQRCRFETIHQLIRVHETTVLRLPM